MTKNNIYSATDISGLLNLLSGNSYNLAYGHFSVIHPGHIRYLKNASKNTDFLIVALQNDAIVRGAQRFRFSVEERAYGLLSTNLCDYIVVLSDDDLSSVVSKLLPSNVFFGTEYQSANIPLAVKRALDTARKENIEIVFDSGTLEYASSDLFRLDVREQVDERRSLFLKSCQLIDVDKNHLLNILDQISRTTLTVIGETIVDEYAACEALGMSGEAPVLVVKELELQTFVGGAAIVAAHAKALGANINFISVLGEDSNADVVADQLVKWDIHNLTVVDCSRPTTYKKRYMVENQKLFRVSKLDDTPISNLIEQSLLDKIDCCINESNGLIFSDFAYGVITDDVIKYVQDRSRDSLRVFADVQCSSQIGSIKKYTNIYLICPNEREARLALQDNVSGIDVLSHTLMQQCQCKYMIMKLDNKGFIAYHQTSPGVFVNQYFPALSANPVDVTGAGDSLLSIMSLCLSADIGFFEAAALAFFICSIAVEQIGNKPITLEKLRAKINYYFS